MNTPLKDMTIEFLDDISCSPTLLPSELRASSQLLRMLTKENVTANKIKLIEILSCSEVSNFHYVVVWTMFSGQFVGGHKCQNSKTKSQNANLFL